MLALQQDLSGAREFCWTPPKRPPLPSYRGATYWKIFWIRSEFRWKLFATSSPAAGCSATLTLCVKSGCERY